MGRRDAQAAELAARLEDVRWMVDTGECLDGAARRLGLKPNTLERWLERNHHKALLSTLVARQPRDHNRVADALDKRPSINALTGQGARRRAHRMRQRARATHADQEAA